MKDNILAISFFGSTKHQLRAYENLDNVDVVVFESNPSNLGTPGSIDDFEKLNIDYSKYFAVITWGDSLFPVIEYFFKKCVSNDITIFGNQHGVNKSIIQILFSSPNKYCKYWNAEGVWTLDRFKRVLFTSAIQRRWISIGSTFHEYLYKTFSWIKKNSNNKILLIHEPNLKSAEGDKHPHDSEYVIKEVIKTANKLGYEIDLKVHPNWKGDMGNSGNKITRFDCKYVDIQFEEIIKYGLVIGSRSSLLYESYLIGIPVFAVESKSSWPDDCISFFDLNLIETFPIKNIAEGIFKYHNNTQNIDMTKVEMLSGPIGNVLDNYLKFINIDREEPKKQLGEKLHKKYLSRLMTANLFDNLFDNLFSKYINFIFHKIIKIYPKSYIFIKTFIKT